MAAFNQPYPVPPTQYPPVQQQQQQPGPEMQQSQNMPAPQGSVGAGQPSGIQQPMMSPTKEPNYALLCRAGQEYVHEIVNKTTEVFQALKVTQLPNGYTPQATLQACQMFKDRKAKVEEVLQTINVVFRKLRLLYDTVMEYTSTLENPPIENSEVDERGKSTDVYKFVSEEHKEVYEQVRQKNQQIKEVIDQMRNLIWEINTMISMRKT